MRILVTGATGFVGLNVVRCLAEAGHEVIAADRSAPDPAVRRFLESVAPAVRLVELDVVQRERLTAVLAGDRPQAVVHAAVVTTLTREQERERPHEMLEPNLFGTVNVLLGAAGAGVRRAIYVSSPSVLAPGTLDDQPVPETAPTRPSTLYGISKQASELVWQRLAALHGLSAASVRIAQPYGPMERTTAARQVTSPVCEWVMEARAGRALRVPAWRAGKDWTYVRDTAEGIATLVTADTLRHDLYHLAAGRLWMVEDVLEALRVYYPRLETEVVDDPEAVNPNIAPSALRGPLLTKRLEADVGFRTRYDLRRGLAEYHAWLAGDGPGAGG